MVNIRIMVFNLDSRMEIAAVSFFSLNNHIAMTDLLKSMKRLYNKVKVEGQLGDPIVLVPEIPELVSYGNNNISKIELDLVKMLQRYFKLKKMYLSTHLVIQNQEFRVDVYILATTKKILIKVYELKNLKDSEIISERAVASHQGSKQDHNSGSKSSLSLEGYHLLQAIVAPLYTSTSLLGRWQLIAVAEYIVEKKLIYQLGSFIIDEYTSEELDRVIERDTTKMDEKIERDVYEPSMSGYKPSTQYEDLVKPIADPKILKLKIFTKRDTSITNSIQEYNRSLNALTDYEASLRSRRSISNIEFSLANFNPLKGYRAGLVPADALTEESVETPVISWQDKPEFERLNVSSEGSNVESVYDDPDWMRSDQSSPRFEADYVVEDSRSEPENIMCTPNFDYEFNKNFDLTKDEPENTDESYASPIIAATVVDNSPVDRVRIKKVTAVKDFIIKPESIRYLRRKSSFSDLSNRSGNSRHSKSGTNQIIIKNLGLPNDSHEPESYNTNQQSGIVKASLEGAIMVNNELFYPMQVSFRKPLPGENKLVLHSLSSQKSNVFDIKSPRNSKSQAKSPVFLSPLGYSQSPDFPPTIIIQPRATNTPKQKNFSEASNKIMNRAGSHEIDYASQSPLLMTSPNNKNNLYARKELASLNRIDNPTILSTKKCRLLNRSNNSIQMTDSVNTQKNLIINPRQVNFHTFKPISEIANPPKSQGFFSVKKRQAKLSIPSIDDSSNIGGS